MPLDYMDNLSIQQLEWLLQSHREQQEQQCEYMAYAFQVGYARANGKKIKKMFEKPMSERVKHISKEDKDSQLDFLMKNVGRQ